MGKRLMDAIWVLAGVAAVVGLGALIYTGWDWIWSALMSPAGGLLAKVAFTGKALKIAGAVVLGVTAAAIGIHKRVRGARGEGTAPAVSDAAPPVFLPPDPNEPDAHFRAR